MRKLVVGTFLTVDGVMQGPGGPEEDREGGFEHGGWSFNYWDDAMGERSVQSTLRAGALLLGRKTYEIFASHWPHVSDEDPIAAKLNSVPKYVASRTLDEVTWTNSTLIEGDVAEAVARLKEEPGDEIQVTGSGELVQTLMEHDLVDEYRLMVHPIVLGSGKKLFRDRTTTTPMHLVDAKIITSGLIILTYRPEDRRPRPQADHVSTLGGNA